MRTRQTFWTSHQAGTRATALSLGALAVFAWVALAAWDLSPYDRYLHHSSIADLDVSVPAAIGLFVAGWVLMILALMLPTTYPVLALYRDLVARRDDRRLLLALCVGGYVAVWAGFGAVAFVADFGLHAAVDRVGWLSRNPHLVAAATLALAGGYQFTSLKYRCLTQCRSPRLFVLKRWTGSRERINSFALGIDSGLFCVGCCWSLMLVMFAVGAGSIPLMLALGAVMAIEKNAPWGNRISGPLGVLLLAEAVLVAATA